jgi:TolB protein
MKKILLLALCFLFPIIISAEEDSLAVVAVGKAELEKEKVSFIGQGMESLSVGEREIARELEVLLNNDFSFYKKRFDVIDPSALRGQGFSGSSPDYAHWAGKGQAFIGRIEFRKLGGLSAVVQLFDIRKKEKVFEGSESLGASNTREAGHRLADSAYQAIVGKKSIFGSKIIFVSDRDARGKEQIKELYMMDFDGKNPRRLTHHRGTVISPDISFDGKQVLYSLIKEGVSRDRNIDLYVMDLESGKSRALSTRKGINSGAVFLPDGNHIALTLSHEGNAEIYLMNLDNQSLKRITNHPAPDVDPSLNVRGDRMAFLSGRPGNPMIYISDPRDIEKGVRRISFVGDYNATPRFSPDGSEIAFSSWLDGRFDIFRISSEGTALSRLTKDFGSNEDPTYSGDGEFIAFSSQRVLSRSKATHDIYIMDREGEIIGKITQALGNCITPRWSK